MKTFELLWRDGKTNRVSGTDIADAFSAAGYSSGALAALDSHEEVVEHPVIVVLTGDRRKSAEALIKERHYTHIIPSGKSHWLRYGDAIVVWSIPANKNIAKFVLGWAGSVWELSRLWAPDGHEKNLLTMAISAAVRYITRVEWPDAVVSYADPNAGHKGGVYRAASWIYHGQSEESRVYVDAGGQTIARRAFHSGKAAMRKAEIEAIGYKELKRPGKERFVFPISRRARKVLVLK